MIKNKLFKKIYLSVYTINIEPLTFKKAVLLCFFVEGIWFIARQISYRLNMSFGIIPDLIYFAVVLISARMMDKDELRRILVWRNIPLPVFAGIMVMFFGVEIIKSELNNFFEMLLPVTNGFFDNLFYMPNNLFLVILSNALFPGFTEEVFFRGIIARRFFRNYSPIKTILLSALLFALAHQNPWQIFNAFFAGIFLGWIYWRYKSIWLCMFIHACHNISALFMSLPYTEIDNSNYLELWHHPLWLDIMGLLLFGFGLLSVSRKEKAAADTDER